tara:strand:- start:178 stop:804 length:627 start_codon:yes stop_codon:yes gene_type:complete
MAMNPATAMFIAKFAQNAAKQAPGLLQPGFSNTAQGRYLKGIKQEGLYDQGQESKLIGDVARKANTQAALSNKNYQGQMINKGTEGSVANIRAMKESEQNVRKQVGQTASDLYFNEQSAKKNAESQLAMGSDKVKAEKRNALIGLLTGTTTAGVDATISGVQNKSVQDAMSKYKGSENKDPQALFDTLIKSVGYEQAIEIMKAMAGGA